MGQPVQSRRLRPRGASLPLPVRHRRRQPVVGRLDVDGVRDRCDTVAGDGVVGAAPGNVLASGPAGPHPVAAAAQPRTSCVAVAPCGGSGGADGVGGTTTWSRVASRPANVCRMAWLMPRMAEAVTYLGYVVAALKPS